MWLNVFYFLESKLFGLVIELTQTPLVFRDRGPTFEPIGDSLSTSPIFQRMPIIELTT